jgi:hypothetical protein
MANDFRYIFEFNYERWYKPLKDSDKKYIPRDVVFIKLSRDDMRDILAGKLDKNIKLAIDNGIAKLDSDVFVRLSSRSPKDSVFCKRCVDASDVERLLLSSQRIYNDVLSSIEYDYPSHIILMPYRKIYEYNEARCFVYKGKCTAITQCVVNYENVRWNLNAKFYSELAEMCSDIRDICSIDTFVMDIEIMNDGGIKLIELNPFGREGSTGAMLFDWEKDNDILTNMFCEKPIIRTST